LTKFDTASWRVYDNGVMKVSALLLLDVLREEENYLSRTNVVEEMGYITEPEEVFLDQMLLG
jgi:hypothetical protein